jgi:hypothetical protein
MATVFAPALLGCGPRRSKAAARAMGLAAVRVITPQGQRGPWRQSTGRPVPACVLGSLANWGARRVASLPDMGHCPLRIPAIAFQGSAETTRHAIQRRVCIRPLATGLPPRPPCRGTRNTRRAKREAARLGPHDRVLRRIVIRSPLEYFNGDYRLFELTIVAFQVPFGEEAQEPAHPPIPDKPGLDRTRSSSRRAASASGHAIPML